MIVSFFIPIRKNSKRVKNKNIKKLGKYKLGLTEIKLNQLKRFKDRIKLDNFFKNIKFEFILSTDDMRIKNFFKKYTWVKFHKRSKNLATDNSLDNLIKIVPEICYGDYILWTHVTSPFFNEKSYIRFLKNFLSLRKKYSSAFSANKINSFIYNFSKKKWISHNRKIRKWPRTQDLDSFWEINSAAFIAKKYIYINDHDRIGKNSLPIKSSIEEAFDVDDIEDFDKLKKILKYV